MLKNEIYAVIYKYECFFIESKYKAKLKNTTRKNTLFFN